MKKIYALLTSVVVAVLLVGCAKIHDFGDINKSPNAPSTPYTSYMLTQAQRYFYYFVTGSATNGYDPWQQAWNGYLAEIKNNQYGPLGTTTTYAMNTFYLYPLKNLHYIIEWNEDPEKKDLPNIASLGTSANQIAAAKTLMGYYYMTLSDIVGPIVVEEAFQGASEDNWLPKYNTQQEVFDYIDKSLSEAFGQFDMSGNLNAAADVSFGGDIAKWKKFNASIRMLAAIKLCDVDAATGKSRFAKAYSDGGMVNVDDGLFHKHDDLNWNMMYYWCNPDYAGAGFGHAPNMYIVDQMKEFKDPRMFKYFDIEGYKGARDPEIFPRDQYTSFYGVPFGLESNTAVSKWVDCCCSINSTMLAMDASLPVITAARVLFTEAEAAYRGWISADAKALYEAGIKSSFEQWGADGADAYIATPAIAFKGGADGLEQIAIQRWIAGYLADGIEAWSDWRRLDIPKMFVGPEAAKQGNKHFPYRLAFYSGQDRELNTANYEEIIKKDVRGGVDDVNGRVWWDVAANTEGVIPDEKCVPSIVIPEKWVAQMSGTYYVLGGGSAYDAPVGADVWGASGFETTLYEDVNHPGAYKLAPFGVANQLAMNWDAGTSTFFVPNQIVGSFLDEDGTVYPVNVADRDTDQESDGPYRGAWDDEDGNLYIYVIYRAGGPRGGGSVGILNYGYDVFVPNK